jgi:hypothetical protein
LGHELLVNIAEVVSQQQGEAAYKKDAKEATSTNRRVAGEEEYTAFKNTKEFKPLQPLQLNGRYKSEAAPAEGLDKDDEGNSVGRRGLSGLDRRPVLVASAALLCSLGLAALARVVKA